jgi:hypothetical protein
MKAGFTPMAMLWNETGKRDPAWVRFAWPWSRPASIYAKYREFSGAEAST